MGGWGLEDMLGRRNSTRQKKADRGLVIVLPYQKKKYIYIYFSTYEKDPEAKDEE